MERIFHNTCCNIVLWIWRQTWKASWIALTDKNLTGPVEYKGWAHYVLRFQRRSATRILATKSHLWVLRYLTSHGPVLFFSFARSKTNRRFVDMKYRSDQKFIIERAKSYSKVSSRRPLEKIPAIFWTYLLYKVFMSGIPKYV